jgi:BirA family transcriptional regulator, biotin operon repressor / biotin---[acetyl-CoA-carboxylase] ligase
MRTQLPCELALLARHTSLCSLRVHTLIVAALKRLTPSEFAPVGVLAASLAASPEAVAEALRQAAAGVPVHYEAGRGYRLATALDWLDAACIAPALRHTVIEVDVVDCCGSTNVELMRRARSDAAHGQVLAAELQTEGRGRQGRRWHSGICTALTFSLLWRFDRPASALGGLSLAVGVAIARALRRHEVEAQLKWPNDLLWRQRKLGGILIEVHGDAAARCAAVIGIGMNTRLHYELRARIDQAVCDLYEAGGRDLSRNDWLVAVLIELSDVLGVFAREGFAALRAEWDRYHAHAGRLVELALPSGQRLRGIASGVDESGRLLLATAHGTQALMTGDVSLRASA